MSTLLKFILMALAWGLLFLTSYYGCIKPEYCPADEVAAAAPAAAAPAAVTDDYAIVSSLGSTDVLVGSQWDSELQSLLAKYRSNPEQTLEVYGHYYATEEKPAGFDNMGLLRADAIKNILVDAGIPAASITTAARLLPAPAPADGALWDAGAFAWAQPAAAGQEDKVTELDRDQIKINFPYNKSTTRLSDNTENYLEKLAQRMQQTEETVAITGHTDVRGRPAYNMSLGQQRADFVKRRLVSYGVDASRISTASRGETQPEIPNATTDQQHYENRRAVLVLNRRQ